MPALAHALVSAPGGSPARWLVALHGILGRGGNLRTIARRFVTERPEWGVVLVDLREHGASLGFTPPHTIDAAAADLATLDALVPGPIRGVLGHSLGGKIALAYYRDRPDALDSVVVLDATPSARALGRPSDDRPGSTARVLRWLEALPPHLPSREALIERATADGLGRPIGEWLAMNLAPRDHGFALAIDLVSMDALFADYHLRDLWPVVEDPPGHARLDLVVAERAATFTEGDRARLERAAATHTGRVFAHRIDTGHWVHAEAPDEMVRILIESTAPPEPSRG